MLAIKFPVNQKINSSYFELEHVMTEYLRAIAV